MAYSKNRRLADLVGNAGEAAVSLQSGVVTAAHLHSSHGITTNNIGEHSSALYLSLIHN